MNQTKKLTQGAMILAIVGAIMLLDRQIAYYFDEMLFLAYAVVIVLYGCMYSLKDAGMIAFGIVVLTLMFGSIFSYVYCPLGIVVGFTYAYGIQKDWDKNRLLIMTSIVMIIGEALIMMVLLPLFGIDFLAGIESVQAMMQTMLSEAGLANAFDENFIYNLIVIIYVFDVLLIGILEAILIHFVSAYLLKRFRIKEVRRLSLMQMKVHPLVAYLSFLPILGMSFVPYNPESSTLFYIFTCLSLVGGIILLALGYIFLIIYGKIVLKKNIGFYIVLLLFLFLPYSIIVMIILGFLYGSGPLASYIQKKAGKV